MGLSLDELHDEEGDSVDLIDFVDGGDVGVVDGGGAAGLAHEAAATVGVVGQFRGQDLDGDVAVELRVEGLVDDPHAPLADLLEEVVLRQYLAGFHRHSESFPEQAQHTSIQGIP